MNTIIEQIKADIERKKRLLSTLESEHLADARKTSPNDLEEAAWDCVLDSVDVNNPVLLPKYKELLIYLFIAGAKWQKEQMMKEAVEGAITNAVGEFGYDVAAFRFDDNHTYSVLLPHEEKRKYGDKVKLIIVKEE